jgi:hypothetical protein
MLVFPILTDWCCRRRRSSRSQRSSAGIGGRTGAPTGGRDSGPYLAELVVKHQIAEDEAHEVARHLAYALAKRTYKL